MKKRIKKHPWVRFLEVRVEVMEWLLSRGISAKDIAQQLSMDETQVRLIMSDKEIRSRKVK